MPSISLPYHSYDLDTPASTSRLVNCYVETLPPDANTPARLVRAPGIKLRYDYDDVETTNPLLSGDRILGMHRTTWDVEYVHAVILKESSLLGKDTFISQLSSSGGTAGTRLAQINNGLPVGYDWGAYSVDIASNVGNVVVVSEPVCAVASPIANNAYQVVNVTDSDYTSRGASHVAFLDNYLLFLEPKSGRFFGADLGSATSFDALNFATAETQPDDAIALMEDHGQLFILGRASGELWENTGVQGFPFQRVVNGRVDIGGLSAPSLKQVDQGLMWLANDKTVRRLQGITPVRLSTPAIDRRLKTANESSYGNTWTHNGHIFYSVTTQSGTFVLDVTTGLWHERKTYGREYWAANHFVNAFGEALCAYGSVIGQLDEDTYDDMGDTQVMSWQYQPVYAEGRRAFHDRLEVVMETGVGLTTGQGSAPLIMLEISDDGGASFRHVETKSLGAIGKRQTRVIWNGLGSSHNRVYRMSVSDPVKIVVTDTQLYARGARL